jgi:hypothetical protein
MERLNYFNPYQSKSPWHEDQLTRAFLVVARLVPLALSVLLDLLREEQVCRGSQIKLPSSSELITSVVDIQTQRNSIPQTTGRLISVVMTDESWTPRTDVADSDRGARYDGVLCFDPSWVIVIENKPSSHNNWEEQVHPNLPRPNEIDVDPVAIVLRWRDVVGRLTAVVAADVLSRAEKMILEDFLEFVDEQFPTLNPFDTFGHCKNSASLLQRRCKSILETVAPGRVNWQPIWETFYILLSQPAPTKMCGLYPAGDGDAVHRVEAAMYPGDTMTQARALFTYLHDHGADRLLALRDRGWQLKSNFHFGFIRTGFGHGVHTSLPLEEYIRYWIEHVEEIEQVSLQEQTFDRALQEFVTSGMMQEDDVQKVVAGLPPTAANFNIIPGIEMLFEWPLSTAVDLDRRGRMVEEFKRTVNEALVACGCEPFDLVRGVGA